MIVLEVGERTGSVEKVSFSSDGQSLRFCTVRRSGGSTNTGSFSRNLVTEEQSIFPSGGEIGNKFCEHPITGWVFGGSDFGKLRGYHQHTKQRIVSKIEGLPSHFAMTPNGENILLAWYAAKYTRLTGYTSVLWSNSEQFSEGFTVVTGDRSTQTKSTLYSYGLAAMPDNERFVTLDFNLIGQINVVMRSVSSGEIINETIINGFDVPALAVSPHENFVAVRVARSVHILDTEDLSQPPRILKNDGQKHFTGVAFHPSGRLLGVTSNDNTAKFYDTQSWAVRSTFDWNIGKLRSIAFSNDGTLAAAGSDTGKVVIWDVDL